MFYDIPVNELERERISEEGLKPERLRSEKNNLILKVDLTRWQQQISFSSFFLCRNETKEESKNESMGETERVGFEILRENRYRLHSSAWHTIVPQYDKQ